MESGWHIARHMPCPYGPILFIRAPEASLCLWILSGPAGVPEVILGLVVVLSPTTYSTHRHGEVG